MKVMIAGGTGKIGVALTRSLLHDNHQVWVLTRNPRRARMPQEVQVLGWNGRTSKGWLDEFGEMDAIVNLAGATIGAWPWSAARKRAILDSRVNAGNAIAAAFQRVPKKPGVLLQMSSDRYYGPSGNEPLDEDSAVGNDFLSNVAINWEASTRVVDSLGVRRVIMRTSVVLHGREGFLPLMALPVRLFVGGPLGSGKQGVSWIHNLDVVRAICFLLENGKARGVFNLCAPNPISNVDFIHYLARALHRPSWFRAPAFGLKLALGEMSTLLLDGSFVIPQRLVNMGFTFQFESVFDAFKDIFQKSL